MERALAYKTILVVWFFFIYYCKPFKFILSRYSEVDYACIPLNLFNLFSSFYLLHTPQWPSIITYTHFFFIFIIHFSFIHIIFLTAQLLHHSRLSNNHSNNLETFQFLLVAIFYLHSFYYYSVKRIFLYIILLFSFPIVSISFSHPIQLVLPIVSHQTRHCTIHCVISYHYVLSLPLNGQFYPIVLSSDSFLREKLNLFTVFFSYIFWVPSYQNCFTTVVHTIGNFYFELDLQIQYLKHRCINFIF